MPYISCTYHSESLLSVLSCLFLSSLNNTSRYCWEHRSPATHRVGSRQVGTCWDQPHVDATCYHLTSIHIDPFVDRILLFSVRCDLAWEDCVDPLPLPIGASTRCGDHLWHTQTEMQRDQRFNIQKLVNTWTDQIMKHEATCILIWVVFLVRHFFFISPLLSRCL